MKSEHYVKNLITPEESHHAVNKAYCDSNSRGGDGGSGLFTGAIAGALAGGVAAAVVSKVGSGLSFIG
jgi:hypothetical protein